MAMGAVLGIAAFGRTQEKMAGAAGGNGSPTPSFTSPAPAAPAFGSSTPAAPAFGSSSTAPAAPAFGAKPAGPGAPSFPAL